MVYETYETSAFVLSAHNLSEGNRIFRLLTKDFGLVKAVAQNVRSEKSKLRYNLQVFSKTETLLVRGREYFRLVGAHGADHFFVAFKGNHEKIRLLRRFFDLLLRLVHGEGKNEYLFNTVESSISALKTIPMTVATLKRLELLTVSRILHSLGYFPKLPHYESFFIDTEISDKLLAILEPLEKELLKDINVSLSESHL